MLFLPSSIYFVKVFRNGDFRIYEILNSKGDDFMDTSDLAKRMKGYEQRNRYYLRRRTPVILRLDMRSGHSFTKGFERPFDEVFIRSMQETAKYLCENIQGCKLSYQQSDEITLLLVDYDKLDTSCFFDYRVDKLCSIAASMATMIFNKRFLSNYVDCALNLCSNNNFHNGIMSAYGKAAERGAMFDCRCFNLPKEEVTNCFYWRQLDSIRNSIQMIGQANFSHKELQHKSCSDIKEMLMVLEGINWDDLPTYQKRGSCCVRNHMVSKPYGNRMLDSKAGEHEWIIDKEIPIFKEDGREYIDRLVFV